MNRSTGLAVAALLVAQSALATDAFEIQVYDGTSNPKGTVGLEGHVNAAGNPDRQLHLTLEPSYGVTDGWEIGGYLQSAWIEGSGYEFAGVKLRSKHQLSKGTTWRIALNFELSYVPKIFEPDVLGGEIRPIFAWETRRFLAVFNPILGLAFTSPGWSQGPRFEPAGMAKVKIEDLVAVGVEYYAGLGTITGWLPLPAQEHYLFETVDLLAVQGLELNLGLGEGLTGGSKAWVVKAIVGYTP